MKPNFVTNGKKDYLYEIKNILSESYFVVIKEISNENIVLYFLEDKRITKPTSTSKIFSKVKETNKKFSITGWAFYEVGPVEVFPEYFL